MQKLKFTGNWYIDAGIIGFINLMEEIYGYDLNQLDKELENKEEKIYYGYFPMAYFYKLWKMKNEDKRNIKNIPLEPKDIKIKSTSPRDIVKEAVNEFIKHFLYLKISKNDIFKNTKKSKIITVNSNPLSLLIYIKLKFKLKYIELKKIKLKKKQPEKLKKLINLSWKLDISYPPLYTNLWFFNLSTAYKNLEIFEKKFKNQLYNIISFNYNSNDEYIKYLDSTINKFLPSKKDFKNIYYTKFNLKTFKKTIPYLFVYLLCIPFAFNYVKGLGNIFFYVYDLETTYYINKRIRKLLESIEDDEKQILKKSLEEIIDEVIKNKCFWSLENLYYICYDKLENQRFGNVEIVRFDKLRISIVEDDFIREKLDSTVQTGDKEEHKHNILKEFLLGNDLFKIYLRHLKYKKESSYKEIGYIISSIYIALNSIDQNKDSLFSDHYIKYNNISDKVKEIYRLLKKYKNKKIFKQLESKNPYPLLNSLIQDKNNTFVNLILKELIKNVEVKDEREEIIDYLFKYIINNKKTWKYYALPLVVEILTNK